MKTYQSAAAAAIWAALASAAPAPVGHAVHEKREFTSDAWAKLDRVHPDVVLPMRIGLTQSNLDRGDELLMDVSHPDSPNYGRHYTAEEVHELFAPSTETVESVRAWLERAGIHISEISHSVNKQWLQFDAPVSKAEELFGTTYHFFEHQRSGKPTIACDEYSVPAEIQHHIDYITPGIKLLAPNVKRRQAGDIEKRGFGLPPSIRKLPVPVANLKGPDVNLSVCGTTIIPECIAALYNITPATLAAKNNQLGIFEDLGDYYAQDDLNLFFASLAPKIPQGTHPILHGVDGGTAPTSVITAGPESDLDFQISYPIIYPQNSILFQTDDPVYEANYTYNGFLNNFLDAIDGSYCSYSAFGQHPPSPLDPPYPDPAPGGYKGKLQCGVYKPTNVISISYGGQEFDLSKNYQKRQCNEFMKLGLQGVSVLISSGDSGVSGPAGDDNSDGCLGANGQIFSPDFPATCPYITAVGATVLPPTGDVNKDEETAVTRFPSGGGFSNIYPIPSYQKAAVNNYLTKYPPPYKSYSTSDNKAIGAGGGIYNRAGRAYPDVSAIGDNVVIFNMGVAVLIGGTSASSPVFASIINRINEERIKAGKPTVGFLNPTLYANPGALHDITQGNNPGCNTTGFAVQPGWDPVTGLGTPNYPALLKLFMNTKY